MSVDGNSIGSRRLLVVGDVMLDRYVKGSVARISPEAPVPVLCQSQHQAVAGGAANVAKGIRALGASVELVGIVGNDVNGVELVKILQGEGIGVGGLIRADARRTTTKTRIVAGHQQIARIDEEDTSELDEVLVSALIDAVNTTGAGVDAIVISDYAKGVCSESLLRAIFKMAAIANVPVVVDPKRLDLAVYRGATVITPNLSELRGATRMPAESDTQVVEAARCVEALTGAAVLVTRSDAGMTLSRNGQDPIHLKAQKRDVADVSGAGDTVVSSIATLLADGVTLDDATQVANIAAGISVSNHGTHAVSIRELMTEISAAHSELRPRMHAPVLDIESIVTKCMEWRQQGLSIGFTNGCFDILHAGHVSLLENAASECDRLVVAVNSDSSVRSLKGSSRPINGEKDRAVVLGALKTVDLVVVFSELTPLELIREIKPNVLIKGGDYTVESIVGASEVLGSGGRVVIVPTVEGISTTIISGRISGQHS